MHHFVLVHLLQGAYYILALTTFQHNIEPVLIVLGETRQIIETQMLNKIMKFVIRVHTLFKEEKLNNIAIYIICT